MLSVFSWFFFYRTDNEEDASYAPGDFTVMCNDSDGSLMSEGIFTIGVTTAMADSSEDSKPTSPLFVKRGV